MKFFKKSLVVLAAAVTALAFSACGGSNNNNQTAVSQAEINVTVDKSSGYEVVRTDGKSDSSIIIKSGEDDVFRGAVLDKSGFEQYVSTWEAGVENLEKGEKDGDTYYHYRAGDDANGETYFLIFCDDANAGVIGSSKADAETADKVFNAIKLSK